MERNARASSGDIASYGGCCEAWARIALQRSSSTIAHVDERRDVLVGRADARARPRSRRATSGAGTTSRCGSDATCSCAARRASRHARRHDRDGHRCRRASPRRRVARPPRSPRWPSRRRAAGRPRAIPGAAGPAVPESSQPNSSTRLTPSIPAAARSSASRMSPRFAGAGSPAASPAISPSSPRVAQTTTDSTPRTVACASTEPQPNVSSSGWATVRRSFTGPAGEGSRGRASLPLQSARRDREPGARAARAPSPARRPLGGSAGTRRSCCLTERS